MTSRITHRDLMLATAAPAAFSRAGWLFEPKYDGFRIMARKDGDTPRLITRNGIDLARPFPELVIELEGLPDLVLDGELVVLNEEGKPQFESLRRRARMTRLPPRRAGTAREAAAIFAFDLLSLAGEDLRNLPLLERKAMLQRVLRKGVRIRYLQHVEEQGEALYRAIAEAELEGIVAKKADAPYRAGRTRTWLKVKTPRFKTIEAKRLEHIRK